MRIPAASYTELLGKGPPEIGLAMLEMSRDIWLKGTLGLPLQEMLRLRSAQLAQCDYALGIRYVEPKEAGLTEAWLAQIEHPERSRLPEREKLALLFAELLITNPEAITDELYDELGVHFSESQMVELTFFVMHCNVVHRFAVAMRVPRLDPTGIVERRLGIPEPSPTSPPAS